MVEAEVRHTLAAIMAADVAGYSRLMAADDTATVAALDAARLVFRGVVEAEGGRIVDTAGDSVLAVFETPRSAVRAAIAAQSQINERAAGLPEDRRMLFRIGITLGEVIEKPDGTVYGDGVNIAARLEAASDPGGITISGTAYDHVRTRIEASYHDLGTLRVKNIPEPVRAYRITPDGGAKAPGRALAPHTLAIAAALVLISLGATIWGYLEYAGQHTGLAPVTADAGTDGTVLAVLPFENLGVAEDETFADGIVETFITDLSKLRNLKVIGRDSTFRFKGKSAETAEIGRTLGADFLLRGSVQRAGDRLRINVQLVDAQMDVHVWAERYDRSASGIFEIQDDITRSVVTELDVKLVEGEQARVWRRSTDNPEAYEYLIRGREFLKLLSEDGLAQSREFFDKALAADPEMAAAIGHLGWVYMLRSQYGYSDDFDGDIERAWALANDALAIDPEDTIVLSLLMRLHLAKEEFDTAADYAQRTVALSPNSALMAALVSMPLVAADNPEEGLRAIEKAFALDPQPPPWYYNELGTAQLAIGRYQEAVDALRTCVERLPGWTTPRTLLVAALVAVGDHQAANAQANALLKLDPDFSIDGFLAAWPSKNPSWDQRRRSWLSQTGLPVSLVPAAKPVIAVLPFNNMSGDPEQEYFSDGLADDLITDLSQLSQLMVISRNSTFVYKGQAVDIREVGEALGASHVLEGGVRRAEGRVRVNAQLIDVETGRHVWADRYDRDVTDIFAIQDDLSLNIVGALEVTLNEGDRTKLKVPETVSIEAHDAFLRGTSFHLSFTEGGNTRARDWFGQAITLDPNYARAHAWLAWVDFIAWEFQWSDDQTLLEKAYAGSAHAVELNPDLALSLATFGWMALWNREFDVAIDAQEKSIILDPNNANAKAFLAESLNFAGHPDRTAELIRDALRLDPMPPQYPFVRGHGEYLLRQYDKAILSIEETLARLPDFIPGHRMLAVIYSELDEMDKARAAVDEILRISPNLNPAQWAHSLPYKDPEARNRFLDGLRKAGLDIPNDPSN